MITQEELKTKLHYNPETGIFTNKIASQVFSIGDIVGSTNGSGYLLFTYKGKSLTLHRIAFLYMENIHLKPYEDVDHINGCKTDNRWENLRVCSRSQNIQNTGVRSDNLLQLKGVTKQYGKYKATVWLKGKNYSAGVYLTAEEASKAVRELRNKLHGSFANHG